MHGRSDLLSRREKIPDGLSAVEILEEECFILIAQEYLRNFLRIGIYLSFVHHGIGCQKLPDGHISRILLLCI
jgi:hypothetical protein